MTEDHENHTKRDRPFIGVRFDCCGVYQRIYRDPDQLYYSGRCPKCLKTLRVEVDPKNGKAVRFLKAE